MNGIGIGKGRKLGTTVCGTCCGGAAFCLADCAFFTSFSCSWSAEICDSIAMISADLRSTADEPRRSASVSGRGEGEGGAAVFLEAGLW